MYITHCSTIEVIKAMHSMMEVEIVLSQLKIFVPWSIFFFNQVLIPILKKKKAFFEVHNNSS